MADDPAVSYSVRELLDSLRTEFAALRHHIEDRFDRMERSWDAKADKSEMAALTVRVKTLEDDKRDRDERERVEREHRQGGVEWRRWLVPVLIASAQAAVLIVQLVK